MIFNQWYVVLDSKELRKGKPLRIRRFNEYLAFWRDESGNACCISDRCCHRGASVSSGKINGNNLECPFHGFVFDKYGKVQVIPANGKNKPVPETMKVPYYSTYEKHGLIWIWWGDPSKAEGEPYFFDDLEGFSYAGLVDHWNVHYSRAIENQLDVVHLPFVHYDTIGTYRNTK